MSDGSEVVGRSRGELKGPNLPEGLEIKYDIKVTRDRGQLPSKETLGEQIMKKIQEKLH